MFFPKETEFSFYNKNKVRDYHINDISSYKNYLLNQKIIRLSLMSLQPIYVHPMQLII